jgi:prepilin-type N-terminal cleavage/methylation domain-containing protein
MWKSEQGFTVNELLVAVAIFSVVLELFLNRKEPSSTAQHRPQ